MKKKLLLLFLFFPFFISAYTKDDIFKLIEKEKICEQDTYNEYLNKYLNLIKFKDLNESDLNFIYENISNMLNYAKENNICNIEDISKLDREKTKNISEILKKVLDKINNANDLNILYNNGEFLEKDERNEFNYVGPSEKFDYKYILACSTLIVFIFLILIKNRILEEILTIILVLLLFVDLIYYLMIKYPLNLSTLNILSYQNKVNNEIKVEGKKVINYPTFASLMGNLKIQNLNIDIPIFYGESKDIYEIGLSLIYSFPGFDGRTIISGHNSILKNLDNISLDTIVKLETNYGVFNYSVYKIEILNDDEFNKLDKDNKTLIIYTCYPFNETKYSNKRYVVYASLVSEEWYD